MISDKPFNKAGLRGAIYLAWHFVKDLMMEEVDDDRFIFTFPSVESKQRVMDQSPWNIKGFPLVLKTLEQGETILQVDFSVFPIWVQVYGLPMGQTTKAKAG